MMRAQSVSRETIADLELFEAEVRKWTPKINLVSKSTLENLWDRHILDSLQLTEMAPTTGLWVDMGSGGGFPGIVLAIWAKHNVPKLQFKLIESDARKSAFLLNCVQKFDLNVVVHIERVESMDDLTANVVSARALASLDELLAMSERLLASDGICVFPKGITHLAEVQEAKKQWSFEHDVIQSTTNAGAAVLRISNVRRAEKNTADTRGC
ncbi:MAG: 16S rRNA (guanine(527)-N(7))-methyltransferase RsmG [Planktomarina sp.]